MRFSAARANDLWFFRWDSVCRGRPRSDALGDTPGSFFLCSAFGFFFCAAFGLPAPCPSGDACPRPSDRRLLRRAGYKHPHAFPGTRTGLSTQHTTHIYNANAEGVAKWSARIEKPHNLSMDGFMKHAEKVVGLGEKPFGRMGPVGATHLKDHAEKFGRF